MGYRKPFILKLTENNNTLCMQCGRQSCLMLNKGYCPALSESKETKEEKQNEKVQ